MADKKGLAALLIADMGKKKGGPSKDADEGEEEMGGKDMAAEDVMTAIQDNDVEALKEALSAFVEHC